MKVLLDHQIFSSQHYGGISRYFANLHYGLNSGNDVRSKIGLIFTNNAYIKNEHFLPAAYLGIVAKQSRIYKFNKWYCRYLIKQSEFDVFHPTYYHPYFLEIVKKPFVLTVHDMINELYPQYFKADPFISQKKKLIERADHIIAISERTKLDTQQIYDIKDNKISVIYHGYQMRKTSTSSNTGLYIKRYLLYVGDRYGYKNFIVFIKASAHLLLKHSVKLICAGGGSFKAEENEIFKKFNIIDYVDQLTISDYELAALYANAIALVYPSIYEGFGLPVLEAFANDCPVITSDTSSLPEVGGDAVVYFNPGDEESIAFAIESVITDICLQDELKLKGRNRLGLFSFETCLQKTKDVYLSLY